MVVRSGTSFRNHARTSGTTANPKGCLLSHEAMVRSIELFGREVVPRVRVAL